MSSLGKCFVFYFKYQPEMLRLYWQKQPPEDFADAETLKMVNAIGDQCCQEVGEFLVACGKIIEKHFSSIARCSLDRPNLRKWHVSAGIWWQTGGRPHKGNWKMQAGVTIPKTRAEIIPWIWCVGKADAEDAMTKNFGEWVKSSTEVDLPTGSVALARIPVLPEEVAGFDLPRNDILNQVEAAFSRISKLQFDNVYNFVKGLKG